jgi:coenzyme F420 hydrogenase subunit beta
LEQGRCFAYCPKAEVDLNELTQKIWHVDYDGSPLGPYRKVLASRAGIQMDRGAFQAGGTVSADPGCPAGNRLEGGCRMRVFQVYGLPDLVGFKYGGEGRV